MQFASTRASDAKRTAMVLFAVATLLALMGASQSQLFYAINGGTPPPWLRSLSMSAVQWYSWALFVPFIARIAKRFELREGEPIVGRIAVHAGFAALFACLHVVVQSTFIWFVFPRGAVFAGSFAAGTSTILATTLHWELLSYAMVVASVHYVLASRRARQRELEHRELETQAARAQLDALKRQMQPHFLFNALNALVSMQREASAEQQFTIRLAELLRRLLESDGAAASTLAEEVRLVDAYLDIERVRLGSRLRATVSLPTSLHDIALPALILQPLVENAITHGISKSENGGEVHVRAERRNDRVHIEVKNSSRATTHRAGNGIALANCERRLALMFGERAHFDAHELPNEGFVAAITLPDSSEWAA